MARCLVLIFAALVAVSQAAPRPQELSAGAGSSTSGGASTAGSFGTGQGSSATISGSVDPAGYFTITIPPQYISNLIPAFSAGGTSSSNNAGNALAAIISLIPNVISSERGRITSAVDSLVDGQVGAITDSIDKATETGGKVVSNGVKIIGTWPKFFGQLVG